MQHFVCVCLEGSCAAMSGQRRVLGMLSPRISATPTALRRRATNRHRGKSRRNVRVRVLALVYFSVVVMIKVQLLDNVHGGTFTTVLTNILSSTTLRYYVSQDCSLHGLKVNKGQAVMYMTYHAQRDSSVFHDADEFVPQRWTQQ